MSRLKGLIIFIGGLVLMVLGIAMWRSPELDWEGFLAAWSGLIHDRFAALGVLVLVIGFLVALSGLRRAVRG